MVAHSECQVERERHMRPRLGTVPVLLVTIITATLYLGQAPVLLTLAVVAALVGAVTLPPLACIQIVIVASFLSRLALPVAGIDLRPEHAATGLLLLTLVRRGCLAAFARAATRGPGLFLGLFVIWSTISSLAFSESFRASLGILGWLFSDWLLLSALIAAAPTRRQLLDPLATCALLASAASVVLWGLALATGSTLGVQRSLDNPAPASFVLSYEANILAGYLALLALVLLAADRSSATRFHRVAGVAALIAIPTTQTRAAVAAVGVGFLVLVVISDLGSGLRRRTAALAGLTAVAFVITSLVGSNSTGPLFDKFGQIANLESGNGAYRVGLAQLAIRDLTDQRGWLFGLGTNSFSQRHDDPSRPGRREPAYLSNLPLQVLYDTGVIGVGLIGALLIAALSGRLRPLTIACFGAYLAVASATSPFWFASTWLLLYLNRAPVHGGEQLRMHSNLHTARSAP